MNNAQRHKLVNLVSYKNDLIMLLFWQVTKMYEDCLKEKEGMVVKYAQAESKNIDVQERGAKIEARMREMMREREQMVTRFKQLKADREKAIAAYEHRVGLTI